MLKKCSGCGYTKEISEFSKSGSKCRKCVGEYDKRRIEKIKARGVTVNEKLCPQCKKTKPSVDFARGSGNSGLSSHCRECKSEERLLARYGINKDIYMAIFQAQKGCCLICDVHNDEKKLVVDHDHDHDTGKVRGLLCNPCNKALGLFYEDCGRMRRAAEYIEGHRENS